MDKQLEKTTGENGRAANREAVHDQRTRDALDYLRDPAHQLEIFDLPIPYQGHSISLIGIKDMDPQRGLGDYQNITYFLIQQGESSRSAVVIDPGLREGKWIREALGITTCEVIISHFHLDHWIGFEAYRGQPLYASPLCKTVLTSMVGVEKTGKSIFVEGRLNDYHRFPLPLRAANDAERLLPIREQLREVTAEQPYCNRLFPLEFFELPYGQTEGTLYGLLDTGSLKVLFASDLFVSIKGVLKVEPHYAFKPGRLVLKDITVMLRAILGLPSRHHPGREYTRYLERLSCPDVIAIGHGLLNFRDNQAKLTHLLGELEELVRITDEHII